MAEFNFTKNIDRSRIDRRYDLRFYIKNTENLFCGSMEDCRVPSCSESSWIGSKKGADVGDKHEQGSERKTSI